MGAGRRIKIDPEMDELLILLKVTPSPEKRSVFHPASI
jgi:hypothetical protein